jgi:hypothetical protein
MLDDTTPDTSGGQYGPTGTDTRSGERAGT